MYIIKKMQKYLLYRPFYGIVHTFRVIEACLLYSEKYNRKLIIDTEFNCWFKEPLNKYINFTHQNFYNGPPLNLDAMTCCPTIYTGQVTKKNILQHHHMNNDTDYEEELLIYTSWTGSGPEYLLNYITFKPIVLDVFKTRLQQLPHEYISVHIRNTDRLSDVDSFLENNKENFKDKNIFLASDDVISINKMKELYGINVKMFSNIPELNGLNIHTSHNSVPTEEFNIDCFVDILLLASGSKYYFSAEKSGYGKLADYLHKDATLFKKLLGDE